jgi:hypothetical protein
MAGGRFFWWHPQAHGLIRSSSANPPDRFFFFPFLGGGGWSAWEWKTRYNHQRRAKKRFLYTGWTLALLSPRRGLSFISNWSFGNWPKYCRRLWTDPKGTSPARHVHQGVRQWKMAGSLLGWTRQKKKKVGMGKMSCANRMRACKFATRVVSRPPTPPPTTGLWIGDKNQKKSKMAHRRLFLFFPMYRQTQSRPFRSTYCLFLLLDINQSKNRKKRREGCNKERRRSRASSTLSRSSSYYYGHYYARRMDESTREKNKFFFSDAPESIRPH